MKDAKLAGVHCILSPFESEFLGGPVFRLQGDLAHKDAITAAISSLQGPPVLVFCRIPSDAQATYLALESAGFRRIERVFTYHRSIQPLCEPTSQTHVAEPKDFDACIEIGRTVFNEDRFHIDPLLDNAGADNLKAAWVKNSLHGRADSSLVVRRKDIAKGFILCRLKEDVVSIDLMGVAIDAQGQGIGRALVRGALYHYAHRATTMTVISQDENLASKNLYQGEGFTVLTEEFTYHLTPEQVG